MMQEMMTVKVEFSINTVKLEVKYLYNYLNAAAICWSRLKGMPQKDLINIRNYDVRHLIPKVCSAVLKNGAEILIESTVK